jgi:phosphopantothenoylcysteine synthetase/decarboxylase
MTEPSKRVLYVVACGGYVAGQLEGFIRRQKDRQWEVCVVATPSAVRFMDISRLTEQTGHVVRSDYKQPNDPDVLPVADAVVVIPATFNTVNKLAAGISDTVALGVIHEAIGLRLPVLVVPTPNAALGAHPEFVTSVEKLRSWGVEVLFDPDIYPLPRPRSGLTATDFLPWEAVEAAVDRL